MASTEVFDHDDMPRAERVVAGDVADVYATLEALDRWSSWVTSVALRVQVVEADRYDVTWVGDGVVNNRQVAVITRGPTHTLAFDVSGRWRLHFRTRPDRDGTRVEVVAEPVKPSRWTRFRNRRHFKDYSTRLRSLLDQLAARVEPGASG